MLVQALNYYVGIRMKVSIIDYGMGNIGSVSNAVTYLGADPKLIEKPENLEGEKIIIPGVGAFGDAMKNLKPFLSNLTKVIKSDIPVLGICLGLQVLFESSDESPRAKGLSILKGKVTPIETSKKLPHIGWNSLEIKKKSCPLFEGIENGYVYYAHTYHVKPKEDVTVATSGYGAQITAAVWKNNVYGVQFHPEKSGQLGLDILNNFLRC